MSLNLIEDARRELRALVNLAACDQLNPVAFRTLTARLEHRLEEIETYLDLAGPVDQDAIGRTVTGLSVNRARYVGHLAVIDGGRQ